MTLWAILMNYIGFQNISTLLVNISSLLVNYCCDVRNNHVCLPDSDLPFRVKQYKD